jgi:AraC-like DNA-binding protein
MGCYENAAGLCAFDGCEEEPEGFIRRFSSPEKFLIEYMDCRFNLPASKRCRARGGFVELLCLDSASGVHRGRGMPDSPIKRGISVVGNPEETEEIIFYPDAPIRGVRIIAGADFLKSLPRAESTKNSTDAPPYLKSGGANLTDPSLAIAFWQIKQAFERGIDFEPFFICKLTEILCLLANRNPATPQSRARRLTEEDTRAMKKARDAIDERLSDAPTIAELAAMSCSSAVKLQNDFKAAYGLTVHNYIEHARMAAALSRLENSDTPIHAIALEVGYKNPSQFAKIFKRNYGVSPNEYRGGKNFRAG